MGANCGRRAPRREPRLEKVFQRDFPKEWSTVSTPDGQHIQVRALQSQLRLQGLAEVSTAHPQGLLHFYLTYLRGDAGGLAVRPSKVPDAGSGLFATRRFAPGELLCVYRGKSIPLAQVLKGNVTERDYLMGGFGLYSALATRQRGGFQAQREVPEAEAGAQGPGGSASGDCAGGGDLRLLRGGLLAGPRRLAGRCLRQRPNVGNLWPAQRQ
ncbi:unnamed protein product [Effrenium voratum]|nr:unnamed protein product [Effrenium voratum]